MYALIEVKRNKTFDKFELQTSMDVYEINFDTFHLIRENG